MAGAVKATIQQAHKRNSTALHTLWQLSCQLCGSFLPTESRNHAYATAYNI